MLRPTFVGLLAGAICNVIAEDSEATTIDVLATINRSRNVLIMVPPHCNTDILSSDYGKKGRASGYPFLPLFDLFSRLDIDTKRI
jgi:hypothetical protein